MELERYEQCFFLKKIRRECQRGDGGGIGGSVVKGKVSEMIGLVSESVKMGG
jgi:hypothetical protein